jgi:hypothetical protein
MRIPEGEGLLSREEWIHNGQFAKRLSVLHILGIEGRASGLHRSRQNQRIVDIEAMPSR